MKTTKAVMSLLQSVHLRPLIILLMPAILVLSSQVVIKHLYPHLYPVPNSRSLRGHMSLMLMQVPNFPRSG